MATMTERVPLLMTAIEKSKVASNAKKAGITISEYIRRAIESYKPREDDKVLEAMIDQMNKTTINTEKSIDDVLAFVAESNKRINAMEKIRQKRLHNGNNRQNSSFKPHGILINISQSLTLIYLKFNIEIYLPAKRLSRKFFPFWDCFIKFKKKQ